MQTQPITPDATKKRGNPQPIEAAQVPSALLTMKLAATLAGISQATLYRRAANDPAFPKLVRMGKRCTRIRAGDLTRWLDAQGEGAAK